MNHSRRPRRLRWIASPFLAWGLHFVTVYSLQGLVCGRGWPGWTAWLGIGVATLLAATAVAWSGVRARREANASEAATGLRFTAQLVAMLSLLSLLAMAFTIIPALLLQPCE